MKITAPQKNTKDYFKITEQPKKKTSELLADCKVLFPVWSYYDNEKLDADFPAPKKATTRYFKKTAEADEKWADVSAEQLEQRGVIGITLRERIIMELQYFKETGGHLDIQNVTLCAGSRYADGGVPGACWGDGGFDVDWCRISCRSSSLRVRESVDVCVRGGESTVKLDNEESTNKSRFVLTCEQCGLQKSI